MAPARKTYWHLGNGRRLPSDYEVATSRLLYYVERGGFELELPASAFYAKHQAASPLACGRWEDFVDPRATTYHKYVDIERERESYVNRLMATIEESGHDRELSPDWIDTLAGVLSPLRFLCHGLQMAAAYVGHMAPSGRLAVAALFQCADEIRRIQRLAQRVAQLERVRPGTAEDGRRRWQSSEAWQPLRRAIEKLLVTYDWGEALVALNVCLKPAIDDVYLSELADLAERAHDPLDAQILSSLAEDCRWHRAWTDAALAIAAADRPANREVVSHWTDAWAPLAGAAARAAVRTIGLDGHLRQERPQSVPMESSRG